MRSHGTNRPTHGRRWKLGGGGALAALVLAATCGGQGAPVPGPAHADTRTPAADGAHTGSWSPPGPFAESRPPAPLPPRPSLSSPRPDHPFRPRPPLPVHPDDPPPNIPRPPWIDPRCTVDRILETSCGVWWGASPWKDDPRPLERLMGRPMDIVYTWHGIDQAEVPRDRELPLVEEGRFLHANIEARHFKLPGRPPARYREIIDGEFDRVLRAQAERIGRLEAPFFLTFDHEADANKRYRKRGSPEEFVQAWRHIVDLYREAEADNVIFVWNVTGWPRNLDRLPGLWPGNEYVDWISWEAYNMTGCELQPGWKHVLSFEEAVRPAYEWVQYEGPKHGIDPEKPVMIGEMGTVPIPGDPEATYDWYAAIPEVLPRYERIRAVKLWDGMTAPSCDFRVLADADASRGFAEASRQDYVNIPDEARQAIDLAFGLALEAQDGLPLTIRDEPRATRPTARGRGGGGCAAPARRAGPP
ncbi:hypothetical protein HNR23_003565 [Nocardiopsis mwathae]|uniref:GH26 domain-containing protein n=1 Tax=Nocardiopsis mwathae TaxID=1472723 RepID=A0A7W9YK97_9ACTN|nr:hypothetical protein [Nocardiopsis mwathae]